jgi:hypothetical protein
VPPIKRVPRCLPPRTALILLSAELQTPLCFLLWMWEHIRREVTQSPSRNKEQGVNAFVRSQLLALRQDTLPGGKRDGRLILTLPDRDPGRDEHS